MKLKELYNRSIERPVNPAVSATNFDPKVEETEIEEYVFTDEIINGLYKILHAIKDNKPYNHVGIWIDGYYGSGKSHFLKYLDYCIKPETRDKALARLIDAVKNVDDTDINHNITPSIYDITTIANWLKKASIDTCIFNLETSYDSSVDKRQAFHHIFWNEFNGKRGLNKFNLYLAQHLEKPLQEKGVFEEFKKRVSDDLGGDWNNSTEAADIVDNELGMVLDIAKELAPTLDIESIRERLIRRDTNISIERFCSEMASYIKDKGDDYRFIFFVDEVSQFINKEKDRFLNMQEVITKLSERCENKVWAAMTSQQDLSEVMDDCQVAETMDAEGKTMGRFEVKVSLKGTQPQVITQKRILDKKAEVKPTLEHLFQKISPSFGLQFKLPTSYDAYESEKDFVDYYPFVPYQFKLIMQVFNSFLNLGYVAKEVKGNERSIIKVIHATAKNNKDKEVGKFTSFDELYNNMFEEGLQARGQRAIDNAISMARKYSNPKLAVRVANVLFMICNISDSDKLVFPATLDNVTTLLINDVTTPRLTFKQQIEKVIDFLCDNNVIRHDQGKNGVADVYTFYSEEERKVADMIKSQQLPIDAQATQLRDIFQKYIKYRNKEQYRTRSFAVGMKILLRSYNANNPDVMVEFAMDNTEEDPQTFALHNNTSNASLVYLVGPQFNRNAKLKSNFYWFCQVQLYMATPAPNEENAKTRNEFANRAKAIFDDLLEPEFKKILDTCPIISGQSVLEGADVENTTGADRYHNALQRHFAAIYHKGILVSSPNIPRNTEDLKKSILRNVNPGDYDGMNAQLTPAENEVELYLNRQYAEVSVTDVLHKFAEAPYGWDNICTLWVINELVRRHKRDYSYSNNPNVDTSIVAQRITSETSKFTLREGKAISQEVINSFIQAWKDIFGMSESFSTNDSTQLYRQSREENPNYSLRKKFDAYNELCGQLNQYSFITPLREARDMFKAWLNERDPLKYFNAIVKQRNEARKLMDTCKEVVEFSHNRLGIYNEITGFVNSNNDNFTFIPAESQSKVDEIKKITTQPWPINIRHYVQLRSEINGILDEKRAEIRKEIAKKYNETFDQLEKSCAEQGVDKSILPDRDFTIKMNTQNDNILVLQGCLNTDHFYAQQSGKILAAVKKKKDEDQGGDGGDTGGSSMAAEPYTMALRTRTTIPLATETEVDNYLADLKRQLMKHIDEGQSVMIIS